MTTFPFFIQSIAIRLHCFFNRKLITDREQEILQREYEEFKVIEHGMAMANEMLYSEVWSIENLPEPALSLRDEILQIRMNESTLVAAHKAIKGNNEHCEMLRNELTELSKVNESVNTYRISLFREFVDTVDTTQLPDTLIEFKNAINSTRSHINNLEIRVTFLQQNDWNRYCMQYRNHPQSMVYCFRKLTELFFKLLFCKDNLIFETWLNAKTEDEKASVMQRFGICMTFMFRACVLYVSIISLTSIVKLFF